MEDILSQLKREMLASYNRKLVQPPEGTFFQEVVFYFSLSIRHFELQLWMVYVTQYE